MTTSYPIDGRDWAILTGRPMTERDAVEMICGLREAFPDKRFVLIDGDVTLVPLSAVESPMDDPTPIYDQLLAEASA